MSDTRRKNIDWNLAGNTSWDTAKVAVLMDIQDELQILNRRLSCTETLAIPRILRRISANTHKPKKRRRKA